MNTKYIFALVYVVLSLTIHATTPTNTSIISNAMSDNDMDGVPDTDEADDDNPATPEVDFREFTEIEEIVYIPDANFKAFLLNDDLINTNGDDEIQLTEAESTIIVDIFASYKDISDLTGIQEFKNITALHCSGNNLTNLSIQGMDNIQFIDCSNNSLEMNVTLNNNFNLEEVIFGQTKINSLELYGNPNLRSINFTDSGISDLDLSKYPKLELAYLSGNNFETLNASASTNLIDLSVDDNDLLKTLNIKNVDTKEIFLFHASNTPNLISICVSDIIGSQERFKDAVGPDVLFVDSCEASQPIVIIEDINFLNALLLHDPQIDLNEDGYLQIDEVSSFEGNLDISNKSITNLLGLEAFDSITGIDCSNNSLSGAYDFSKNTKLQNLDFSNNNFVSVNLLDNLDLKIVNGMNNNLSSVYFISASQLEELNLSNNKLENIVLSQNPNLKKLDLSDNPELLFVNLGNEANTNFSMPDSFFDLRNNGALEGICVDDITYATNTLVNVDDPSVFTNDCEIFLGDYIDFPGANFKKALLSYDINNDAEIQRSEALAVEDLKIQNRGISDLTGIQEFKNLLTLDFSDNTLSNVVLSGFERLSLISCSRNKVPMTLEIYDSKSLGILSCSNGAIKELRVKNCESVGAIFCDNNEIAILEVDNLPTLSSLICNSNKLNELDLTGVPNLSEVSCKNNPLQELYLNEGLNSLDISGTLLESLDTTASMNLSSIDVIDCQPLKYLNLKNKTGEVLCYPSGVPNLKVISVDDPLETLYSIYNNYDASIVLTNAVIDDFEELKTIQGKVKFDLENNGCSEEDADFSSVIVTASNDNDEYYLMLTDDEGNYDLKVESNDYDVALGESFPDYFEYSPNLATVSLSNANTTEEIDFCVNAKIFIDNLSITLIPVFGADIGQDEVYTMVYQNISNETIDGEITLLYDETKQVYLGAAQKAITRKNTSKKSVENSLKEINFVFSDLQPYEERSFEIPMNISEPEPEFVEGEFLTPNRIENIYFGAPAVTTEVVRTLSDNSQAIDNTIQIVTNPVRNVLELQFTDTRDVGEIYMISSIGQKINLNSLSNRPEKKIYDISMLATGIYLLKVHVNQGTVVRRVLKID